MRCWSRRPTTAATSPSSAAAPEPSRAAPEIDFALGGRDFQGDTGNAREVGDVPFNVFARAISSARRGATQSCSARGAMPSTSTPENVAPMIASVALDPGRFMSTFASFAHRTPNTFGVYQIDPTTIVDRVARMTAK